MEIHKNTSPRIEKLFDEARNEKPVMKMDEVKNIVSSGSYPPAGSSRGFTIGMNNLIVISGIVVSSFLAYMTLKVDNRQEEIANTDAKQEVSSSEFLPSTNSTTINSEPALTKNYTASVVPPGKNKVSVSKNKISNSNNNPQKASDELLASNVGNIISTPVNTESIVPAEVNNTIKRELPSGEYKIGFTDGSEVKMTLQGNKVSTLIIDGQEISVEDYDKYQAYIDEGRSLLVGKHERSQSDKADISSTDLIYFFDGELCKDKVPNDEKHYIFELTSSILLVDGKEQSSDVFSKYKKLYEEKTGKVISKGSVYKFEKGAK